MKKKLLTMLFVVVLVLAVMSIAFVGCKKDKPEITLSGITVSYSGSENLDFGTQLDKANLAVKAIMSDNSEVNVDVSAFEISGFNPSQLGEQTVTVSYQGKSATFKVTVIKTLQSISASYKGEQLFIGDELDNADIEVKAHYSDNSEEDVESFEVSGFSSEEAGNKELTISALGKEYKLSINVLANSVESLEASYKGDDLFVGDELDKADIELKANYADGSDEIVNDFELSGYNAEIAGEQSLIISFGGKSTELKINVKAIQLESINVSLADSEFSVREGGEISLDDLAITALFNNGSERDLDENDYDDIDLEYDFEEFGEKEVIVSFGGKSASLIVNVKGSVESLSVTYVGGSKSVGSFLLPSDLQVIASYNDGSEDEQLSEGDYTVSGFNSDEAGICTITVSFACGNNVATETASIEITAPDPNAYTLHDYMGAAPTNFNPHTWETNADNVISSYAEMAFVDVTIADDGVNFEWVLEMAEDIIDVTELYNGQSLGGKAIVPEGVTEGQVYRIKLNKLAQWEDGTPINADTYVESMKRLLDPKMQNYRANTYYNGDTALKNAAPYFNAGAPIYAPIAQVEGGKLTGYLPLDGKTLAFSWNKVVPFFGSNSPADYYDAGYTSYFKDANGVDLYRKWAGAHNAYGVVPITAENQAEIFADLVTISGNFGDPNPEAYNEWIFYLTGYGDSYDWENVGLKKVDDYTIDYILENATSQFYFYTGMTSNWLVYTELYDSLKSQAGDLFTTTYGTSVATYKSYGPYKLDTFQKDRQLTFVKNPNWYGWNDGKHEGQFQTTNIVIDVIANEATIENLFLAGQLDSLGLNSTQLSQYRTSDYLLKTDQTYTFRFVFATDKSALAGLEDIYNAGSSNPTNLKILSYKDFRKALSLSIDRAALTAQATGGYKPAYSLFNSLYYYDIEHNTESIYRNTDVAMQTVCDLYNVQWGAGTDYPTLKAAYDSITGLDVAQAKALFTSAYNAAKEAGDYTDGQAIVIHCMCSAADTLSEDDTAQERLLTRFVATATEGTPLEGKISFVFQCGSSTRYDDVAAGKIEMIRGAWGGAAFYPFSTIRVYTNPTYMGGLNKIHESCGWNPSTEKLKLVYDFDGDGEAEEVEMTLEHWSDSINGGIKEDDGSYVVPSYDDPEAKLFILSKLEKAVLESYQCIPWSAETSCSLFSQKIHYATLNYNIMYGYGGIRLMTYNYNDAEWAAYVKAQGGTLTY